MNIGACPFTGIHWYSPVGSKYSPVFTGAGGKYSSVFTGTVGRTRKEGPVHVSMFFVFSGKTLTNHVPYT